MYKKTVYVDNYYNSVVLLLFLKYSVDSIMLVEEGFRVMSTDASDKMLKYALKERWNRVDQPGFRQWRTFNKIVHYTSWF